MSQSASATFHPNATSFVIMKLIHGYFSKTKKPWNLIDQKWILDKLEKWHGLKISRSTLNYNLKILRGEKIIETVTRHRRDPKTGAFKCEVTLYKRTSRLKSFFNKLAKYFERCDWVPSVKRLAFGMIPVVGKVQDKAGALKEMLDERRRKQARPGRKKAR